MTSTSKLRYLLKQLSTLTCCNFYTLTQWDTLDSGKYKPRGLSCGRILYICQDILKSADLPHKRNFIDFQLLSIVNRKVFNFNV